MRPIRKNRAWGERYDPGEVGTARRVIQALGGEEIPEAAAQARAVRALIDSLAAPQLAMLASKPAARRPAAQT